MLVLGALWFGPGRAFFFISSAVFLCLSLNFGSVDGHLGSVHLIVCSRVSREIFQPTEPEDLVQNRTVVGVQCGNFSSL